MTLAEDVARWTWHKGRFEEIFGERSEGRFAESWPKGKSLEASTIQREFYRFWLEVMSDSAAQERGR